MSEAQPEVIKPSLTISPFIHEIITVEIKPDTVMISSKHHRFVCVCVCVKRWYMNVSAAKMLPMTAFVWHARGLFLLASERPGLQRQHLHTSAEGSRGDAVYNRSACVGVCGREKTQAERGTRRNREHVCTHACAGRCKNSSRATINPDTKEHSCTANMRGLDSALAQLHLVSAQAFFQNIGHWLAVRKKTGILLFPHRTTHPRYLSELCAPDRCTTQSVAQLDSFLFEDDWRTVPPNQPLFLSFFLRKRKNMLVELAIFRCSRDEITCTHSGPGANTHTHKNTHTHTHTHTHIYA